MSVMFAEIKERLKTPKQLKPIKGIYFAEILYADDTLFFGDCTASINRLLKEIEQESAYYNMNLKTTKNASSLPAIKRHRPLDTKMAQQCHGNDKQYT